MRIVLVAITLLCCSQIALAQELPEDINALKQEIQELNDNVNHVQVNLGLSKKRFQRGILVATLGYSITIAGGLMLGRERDELGQSLLVLGGATGITGTYLLVDSFKFLGRAAQKQKRQ